jgi:hypothetical protein
MPAATVAAAPFIPTARGRPRAIPGARQSVLLHPVFARVLG